MQFHPDPDGKLSENLHDIYHCCVQRKTPGERQRNCPKHVQFHPKNKYEKLVHLVGFIIRTVTMHSHMNVKYIISFVSDLSSYPYIVI